MVRNSIANSMIKDPLSITAFNDKLIDDLHKSIHPTIIAGKGYSSRWPTKLRYAIHYHCSVKLYDFRLEQLLCKISYIHKFINHSKYKNLFINVIDSDQLSSGVSTPILETLSGMCNALTAFDQHTL